ncbi:transposase [Streptomyces pseudovenezuelae]|uniref:Transposase n=1 Tax=Streptomyces pseudovenezuelae TaxID=67350 RepID=A0ABZ1XD14_9ACTN|nr:transposase [Streptomyces pseudovenezuelae]
MTAGGCELFDLVDALLCAEGPVTSPVDLTLVAEHRRGHGAMYEALTRARASCKGSSRPVARVVSQSAAGWLNWAAMNWAVSAVRGRRPAARSWAKARQMSAVPVGGSGLPSTAAVEEGERSTPACVRGS